MERYRQLTKTTPRIKRPLSRGKFERFSEKAHEEYYSDPNNYPPEEFNKFCFKEAKRRLVFLFNRCEVYEKILDNYKHYLTPEKFQKLNEREGFDFLINFLNSYNLLCQSLAKVSSLYTGKDLTEYEIEVLEMMKLLNFEEKQLVVDVVREIKNLKWIDRRNYILKKARFIKEQRRKQRRK